MFDNALMELIENKKNQIIKELAVNNDKADYLENFISKNCFYGIDNIQEIDLPDLFIASLLTHCPDISFEKVEKATNDNLILFEKLPAPIFDAFFSSIVDISKSEDYEKNVNDCIEDDNFELSPENVSSHDITTKIIEILTNKKNTDILALVDIYHEYPEGFKKSVSIIYALISFREEIAKHYDYFEDAKAITNKRISQKETDKIIKNKLYSIYDFGPYKEYINDVFEYCQQVVSSEKNRQKELHKELNYLSSLQEWMKDKNNTNSSLNIHPKLLKIKDEDIRTGVLKNIYKYNYQLCLAADEKHTNLLKNSINHYKKVLKKYNIYVSDEEIDFKMNVDEMKDFLEKMNKLDMIKNIDIVKVLKTTTADISNTIFSYINKGYINVDFIKRHQNIFDNSLENGLYHILEKNIDYLNSQNVSSSVIMKMKDNLLEDNQSIIKGIKTLKDYQLFQSLKKADSYQFIKDNELDNKIDFLIELGYETNIQEDLELLNYTIDDYKRLVVLNRLNIPIESTEELKAILSNKTFVVDNDKMSDYLFDRGQYVSLENTNSISKEEFQELLEEKNETPNSINSYIFNDMIISKNKVKKELKSINKKELSINDQFRCLTKNKILSDEDYTTIINLLNSGKIKQERKNIDKTYEKTLKN